MHLVADAVVRGDERRQGSLVIVTPAILLEAKRQRLQVRGTALPGQPDDSARVDACREKRTDRNVGDHVIANRLEKSVVHDPPALRVGYRAIVIHRLTQGPGDRKELHR